MARSLFALVFAWALLAMLVFPSITQAAPASRLQAKVKAKKAPTPARRWAVLKPTALTNIVGGVLGVADKRAPPKKATTTATTTSATVTATATSVIVTSSATATITSVIAPSGTATSTSVIVTTSATATTTSIVGTTSVTLSSATTTSTPSSTPLLAPSTGKIRGVNLGGWFILEEFLTPSVFTAAQQAGGSSVRPLDQWTLMTTINNDAKAREILQQHWSTFIVESDFSQIKNLGLNTVRIPVPHWAFSSSTSEPYLAGAELPYIDQAVALAAKYGLNVMLDMHTAPGSQNGFDNSGRIGPVGFGSSPDNVDRLYTALTAMVTRYVNDPKYGGIVKSIEVLNEPLCSALGADFVAGVYKTAADRINAAISSSASRPQLVFHDCFAVPLTNLAPFVSGGGVLAGTPAMIDTHRYQVFAPRVNLPYAEHVTLVKQDGDDIAAATATLGRQIVTGEFSLAISCTDCPTGYSATVTAADVAKLNRQFFETQTVAYDRGAGWIFFNWKAENNWPWSFKDAYALNWIPQNILAIDEAL